MPVLVTVLSMFVKGGLKASSTKVCANADAFSWPNVLVESVTSAVSVVTSPTVWDVLEDIQLNNKAIWEDLNDDFRVSYSCVVLADSTSGGVKLAWSCMRLSSKASFTFRFNAVLLKSNVTREVIKIRFGSTEIGQESYNFQGFVYCREWDVARDIIRLK